MDKYNNYTQFYTISVFVKECIILKIFTLRYIMLYEKVKNVFIFT